MTRRLLGGAFGGFLAVTLGIWACSGGGARGAASSSASGSSASGSSATSAAPSPSAPSASGSSVKPEAAQKAPSHESLTDEHPSHELLTEPPLVLITDANVLRQLEKQGLSFGQLFFGAAARDNRELAKTAAYRAVKETIAGDIRAVQASDRLSGVSVAKFSHRLFDEGFFTSPKARFELVGLSNRLDRAPFHPGSCGEVRLVYRLIYTETVRGTVVTSRLPATAIGEFVQLPPKGKSCRDVARAWHVAAQTLAKQPTTSGALASVSLVHLHQLAFNLQTVRWPSTVRPDLGGHAEYALRAFSYNEKTASYAPRPLENTLNVDALRASGALRKQLLALLLAPDSPGLAAAGTLQIPEQFLAKVSRSVTPRGLSRLANRPFSQVFKEADFAPLAEGAALSDSQVKTAAGYLRRLDGLTCGGCHEARSVAGFHLLGEDPRDMPGGTALLTPISPHLNDDLARRARVAMQMAAGEAPDVAQGFAEHLSAEPGKYGAHCGLGDEAFRDWTCASGLSCSAYDAPTNERDQVGVCLPDERQVGDPCEVTPIRTSTDPTKDGAWGAKPDGCSDDGASVDLHCSTNRVGFPGGLCVSSCASLRPEMRCGAIANLQPFNACLARGAPFTECIQHNTRPGGLRGCSMDDPCRDDYACVQTPNGGVCVPPYFLFQLRVDGHVASHE